MSKVSKKGKGRGKKPPSGLRLSASSLQECQPEQSRASCIEHFIFETCHPNLSCSPAVEGLPHSQPYDRLTVKAVERVQCTQYLQRFICAFSVSVYFSPSPCPLSSDSMCLCAYESVFYLHYPCLLLATETKYFKAEKASLPTGLLLCTLFPAQERSWWRGSFQPQSIVCAVSSHALMSQETRLT